MAIITEDPTCDRWLALANNVSTQLTEWAKRDPSIPISRWTQEQHQVYESAKRIILAQADQVIPLARDTPHRVMRELYEQQIAYGRAYAGAIPSYAPTANNLIQVSNSLGGALNSLCAAIKNLSASNRAESVPALAPPTVIAPVGNPAEPKRFLVAPSSVCQPLQERARISDAELSPWLKTNSDAKQRDASEKILWETAAKVLARSADEYERLGRTSSNPVTEDFLLLSAQYYRAFVSAMPTSTLADDMLYQSAAEIGLSVFAACDTVA